MGAMLANERAVAGKSIMPIGVFCAVKQLTSSSSSPVLVGPSCQSSCPLCLFVCQGVKADNRDTRAPSHTTLQKTLAEGRPSVELEKAAQTQASTGVNFGR